MPNPSEQTTDTQPTLGDRVEAALKAAGKQAMRNSNMGAVEAYRSNHMIRLIETIRTEERLRCYAIVRKRHLDEYATEILQEIWDGA